MVRRLIAAAVLLLPLVQPAFASGPEALFNSANLQWGALPLQLEKLQVEAASARRAAGPLLGSFVMAERLDTHRDLLTKQVGALTYDISLAQDSAHQFQYFSFRMSDGSMFYRKIESMTKLRNEGLIIAVNPQTTYKFKITPNLMNPIRGSTFSMDPVAPTKGPAHSFTTGVLLDRLKAESFLFKVGNNNYQVLYGTDVDAKTETPAASRSFLITIDAGMNTKAWPIAEAALPLDKPMQVALDQTTIVLTRSSAGTLKINANAKSSAFGF